MPHAINAANREGDANARIGALLGDGSFCANLTRRLEETLEGRRMRFMEVCGTHTVAIFKSGLRSLLPSNIIHVSGPGCPVCVTHEKEVSAFLQIARKENVILATFGDLIRVPSSSGDTLKRARSEGADIRIVYSPLDALRIAQEHPEREIVFPGIGFETTAPLVAAVIQSAKERKINNFSVLSLHKLVPPALRALLSTETENIDAFLLPGHVAAVTGPIPFGFLASEYGKPATVGGFEPGDILLALTEMARSLKSGKPAVVNAYSRAVSDDGNPRARYLMRTVFRESASLWRGLGKIEKSGLKIKEEFADFDAENKFYIDWDSGVDIAGCKCGEVLKGTMTPDKCPLFGKRCVPANPVGPCMVSSEGSCAAYYKYGER